jgi:hypothetical protein
MMAIGLGKFAWRAAIPYVRIQALASRNIIRTVGRQVLASGKVLGRPRNPRGCEHNTAQLTAVAVEEMEQKEEELLATVKTWMGRIPFDLDILMLDEIGKNISGAGMDTKVVNRSVNGLYNPWDTAPNFERIYIRGISDLSYRNAVGLGMADIIHDRLLENIDWTPTRINSLTASTPAAIRTPIHFGSDRQCLETVFPHGRQTRYVGGDRRLGSELGRNRPDCDDGELRNKIEANSTLEIVAELDWPYDADGNLPNVSALGTRATAG